MIIAFYIIVLIFSVIVHEVAHGFVALHFGDQTAKNAGRLTLNPFKHLDPFGSVLLPLLLAFSHLPVFGWAKPVPYDPRNLRHPKRESGYIAVAGPLTNLFVAVVFAILVRVLVATIGLAQYGTLIVLLDVVVWVNLALTFFNLIPIPPLDGSGVLFSLLPPSARPFELLM
ncbi:MAG: site-2 protease family protein, partial [bacterium]|nr:site-2 protease family protein [bacterium]